MSLVEDLKTFVIALALGVALTFSINYAVVNYTEGPASAQASQQYDDDDDDDAYYQAPKPAPMSDVSASSVAYY